MALRAQWEKTTRVQVIDEKLGLVVAYVVKQPMGWKVFPQTTARKPSRKFYDYPADAIKAYYGKLIQIEAAPNSTRAKMQEQIAREEKPYELLHGVFKVSNQRVFLDDEPRTIAYIVYVRLVDGLSRGAALKQLVPYVAKRNRVAESNVTFAFWCDGYASEGGSPQVLRPQA